MANKETEREKREDALVSLYEESYERVVRYIFVRIGNREEAEDLASGVFLKALNSLDTYQERGLPMVAWVFRIAHNIVVDYLRKTSKKQMVRIDDVPGWQCKYGYYGSYIEGKEKVLYHAAATNCWRMTIAFVFNKEEGGRKMSEMLVEDLQSNF